MIWIKVLFFRYLLFVAFVVLPNSVMVPVSGITFFGSGADLSNHFVSGLGSDVKTMCVKKR